MILDAQGNPIETSTAKSDYDIAQEELKELTIGWLQKFECKVVHCKQEPDCTMIDRTTVWGNRWWQYLTPEQIKEIRESHLDDDPHFELDDQVYLKEFPKNVPHGLVVSTYAIQLQDMLSKEQVGLWDLWELRNDNLGCWCKHSSHPDKPCHGDVLRNMIAHACAILQTEGMIIEDGRRIIPHFMRHGDHSWLSNMHYCQKFTDRDGIEYTTSENYYQGQKTDSLEERRSVARMKPAESKNYANKLMVIRKDWSQDFASEAMMRAIRYKFQDPALCEKLLDTGDDYLQEGNYWNDKKWGVCLKTGVGKNLLGRLLMGLRDELSKELSGGNLENSK